LLSLSAALARSLSLSLSLSLFLSVALSVALYVSLGFSWGCAGEAARLLAKMVRADVRVHPQPGLGADLPRLRGMKRSHIAWQTTVHLSDSVWRRGPSAFSSSSRARLQMTILHTPTSNGEVTATHRLASVANADHHEPPYLAYIRSRLSAVPPVGPRHRYTRSQLALLLHASRCVVFASVQLNSRVRFASECCSFLGASLPRRTETRGVGGRGTRSLACVRV
jgi:hypothetical protein